MPLPVLTWNISTEQQIAATVPTYAEFLNKIDAIIAASTHWKVNAKNLDAVNSRGWIELAPKSALAGVTEGRVLILFSTGTVTGAAGSERPVTSCRNAPWATATASLGCKMWAGFSPNAATAEGVGPAGDPWTSATPYGASYWSKLCPLNAGIPDAGSTMQLIESAEVFALSWFVTASVQTQGIIAGRVVEDIGGESALWGMFGHYASPDTSATTTAWNSVATQTYYPPIGQADAQVSNTNTSRSWGFAIDASGTLLVVGRTLPAVFQSGGPGAGGFSNATQAAFTTILLGGGTYNTTSKDALVGIMRQVRWGPAAYRGQTLYAGSPIVAQGIHLNYAIAATGAKIGGLWFDNFR